MYLPCSLPAPSGASLAPPDPARASSALRAEGSPLVFLACARPVRSPRARGGGDGVRAGAELGLCRAWLPGGGGCSLCPQRGTGGGSGSEASRERGVARGLCAASGNPRLRGKPRGSPVLAESVRCNKMALEARGRQQTFPNDVEMLTLLREKQSLAVFAARWESGFYLVLAAAGEE